MFGYITVNQDELKGKDYKRYRAYYCGLCRMLRMRHGNRAQITLTYDMTFLVILLTGLYEPELKQYRQRCTTHLGAKQVTLDNEFSSYAADMNVLLSFHNLMDDWKDERRAERLLYAKTLEKTCEKVAERYPRQSQALVRYMEELSICEKENCMDIDRAAGLTGEMLGEIFVCHEDEWSDTLRQIGFYLGKFIYLMDAYEDIEKDIKKKQYNPLKEWYRKDGFEEGFHDILQMMAAEAAREFEKLPILKEAEIIRNILYSGMWIKYGQVQEKRKSYVNGHIRKERHHAESISNVRS